MPLSAETGKRSDRHRNRNHGGAAVKAAAALLLAQALLVGVAGADCLKFADAPAINALFSEGGPGTKVFLCPSRTYRLDTTIIFTAADQELATEGYPKDGRRATLLVNSVKLATAVQGDCRRCARVSLKSLVIDGNRKNKGRIVDADLAGGLIVLGGNEGPSVTDCVVRDPRGWTAIHIREGDKLSCSGAIVRGNEIGPVGEEYVEAVDGPDPEMSPLGRPLGDGLSIACRDSFVQDNIFHDNTDAAIVVYCSPGSTIARNQIYARTRSAMAGILLVDATPFDGDYSDTSVASNVIDAASFPIRVGIGLGAAVWSDDTDTVLTGGSVSDNVMRGLHMGFGIAASGLLKWKISDNWSEARHSGRRTNRCFDEPINPSPVAFLYNKKTIAASEIQQDFVDGEFAYAVCIDGGEDESNAPDIVGKVPAKDEVRAQRPEVKEEAVLPPTGPLDLPTTGSEVMDGILLHSQQRMLEAISALGVKVEGLQAGSSLKRSSNAGTITPMLASRIKRLEDERHVLSSELELLRKSLKSLSQEIEQAEHENAYVFETVIKSLSSGETESKQSPPSDADTGWGLVGRMILGQLVFGVIILLYRHWVRINETKRIGKRL